MKIIPFIQKFEKEHMNATLVIGALVGVGVGMFLFSLTVPESQQFNRMYSKSGAYTTFGNRGGVMMLSGSSFPSQMMRSNFGIATTVSTDSINSSVTNEKQFLSEMIVQDENIIRLAHRVLSLTGVSDSISSLAEKTILEKDLEISSLKDLLMPKTTTTKTTKSKTR